MNTIGPIEAEFKDSSMGDWKHVGDIAASLVAELEVKKQEQKHESV